VTADPPPALEVRVRRRVHEGLEIDAELALEGGCGVLFGRSGAGKSTLLRLIAGLDRPDGGRVAIGGEALFDDRLGIDVPLRRRRIGMIFQDDLLFPHRSVAGNIGFGLLDRPRAARAARIAEVADLCGVAGLLGRRPSTLSGGERQRVGLARALAPRPRLLLCDEPFSALDQGSRSELRRRLEGVRRAEGLPVLFVTHDAAEALAVGTMMFRVEAGRIAARGAPLDVLASPSGGRREGLPNVFRAVVEAHDPGAGETRLRIDRGGPVLVVAGLGSAVGSAVIVTVRADDVLLAAGPVVGLSARNLIAGTVERVVGDGPEVEVVVRTGGVAWIASVVRSAVASLGLAAGSPAWLVVKARSCRVEEAEPAGR